MPYADILDTGAPKPSFREALRFWLKLGCISFGGPAGQIAMMQTELVDRRRWIDQGAFLRGLNFCTLLPGPEAQQLATYVGWRLHGLKGGIAAGGLFVLPGALLLLLLSWIAAAGRGMPTVAAVLDGLKPVVIAVIAHAVWRIGRRALKGREAVALAVAAFVGIHFLRIDFPWIVLAAGAVGFLAAMAGSTAFAASGHGGAAVAGDSEAPAPPFWSRVAIVTAIYLAMLALPVAVVLATFGTAPFADIAQLFTKAAFVTFGGAYAVLPYVADEAVRGYGWLTAGEMLDGMALAETTPGPLILVLQYVGFFAAWNAAPEGGRLLAASVGAALTTWCTFLPSFAMVLLGAPYIERLHADARIGAALAAITAAVVGVILNLAVFLAGAVLIPAGRGVDWVALLAAAAALAALIRWNLAIHWLVLAGIVFGLARAALSGSLA
ncbi:MAG: chromate efflux transporter [Alphaproteobacteria bacterium]|nr:chromate efflux transporter [Alphaproteobacteria bacterium]MBM3628403.1 chromate efflux transporter [Alphaproteobacteria bacterium]